MTAHPSERSAAQPATLDVARSLLDRAAALVERSWTQHADARAANGTAVAAWDPSARSWSLLGALVASLEEHDPSGSRPPLEALSMALDSLAGVVDDDSLTEWNDLPSRTQADTVIALRSALAAV